MVTLATQVWSVVWHLEVWFVAISVIAGGFRQAYLAGKYVAVPWLEGR